MMKKTWPLAIALTALLALPQTAASQTLIPMQPDDPPATTPVAYAPQYSQEQLDQMLAPIALYPDPLIAQILVASAYPLEIVEAHRWLQDPANAALKDGALQAVLDKQTWDPSVKALVSVPQVLGALNNNLKWTESLGNAILAQQQDVMDSVQRLRQMAQAAGSLKSTPQQTVTDEGSDVYIQPAAANTIYVPYYNPAVVYGSWPYADYPPYYFVGYTYTYPYLYFSPPFPIFTIFFRHHYNDWHNHRIEEAHHEDFRHDHGWRTADAGSAWQPDPTHRHGVHGTTPPAPVTNTAAPANPVAQQPVAERLNGTRRPDPVNRATPVITVSPHQEQIREQLRQRPNLREQHQVQYRQEMQQREIPQQQEIRQQLMQRQQEPRQEQIRQQLIQREQTPRQEIRQPEFQRPEVQRQEVRQEPARVQQPQIRQPEARREQINYQQPQIQRPETPRQQPVQVRQQQSPQPEMHRPQEIQRPQPQQSIRQEIQQRPQQTQHQAAQAPRPSGPPGNPNDHDHHRD
jgi:hypothetical protein